MWRYHEAIPVGVGGGSAASIVAGCMFVYVCYVYVYV